VLFDLKINLARMRVCRELLFIVLLKILINVSNVAPAPALRKSFAKTEEE